MKNIKIFVLFGLFFGCILDIPVYARDSRNTDSSILSAEASMGAKYDSNVSVEELDQEIAQGDTAILLAGKVGFQQRILPDTNLKLGASFSQKSYEEFSTFDLDISLFSAQLAHDFDTFKVGVGARLIATELDSEDFLDLKQSFVFASGFPSKNTFVRTEFTYAEKEFDLLAERNTEKNAIGADLNYFLDGTKRYWAFGYKYEDEDADFDQQFSRSINSIKVRYSQKSNLFARDVKYSLKARFQTRDYKVVNPAIGEMRNDDRFRLGAEIELSVNRNWFIVTEYEYSDYSSNLPTADYSQNVVAIKIGWRHEN